MDAAHKLGPGIEPKSLCALAWGNMSCPFGYGGGGGEAEEDEEKVEAEGRQPVSEKKKKEKKEKVGAGLSDEPLLPRCFLNNGTLAPSHMCNQPLPDEERFNFEKDPVSW